VAEFGHPTVAGRPQRRYLSRNLTRVGADGAEHTWPPRRSPPDAECVAQPLDLWFDSPPPTIRHPAGPRTLVKEVYSDSFIAVHDPCNGCWGNRSCLGVDRDRRGDLDEI
jgi:hypothetical protein